MMRFRGSVLKVALALLMGRLRLLCFGTTAMATISLLILLVDHAGREKEHFRLLDHISAPLIVEFPNNHAGSPLHAITSMTNPNGFVPCFSIVDRAFSAVWSTVHEEQLV